MKGNTMKQITPAVIGVIIAVGILAFFGGMKYQGSRQPAFNRQAFGGPQGAAGMRNNAGGGGMGGRAGANRPVSGDVISTDDTSITVKLPDGSSKIVLVTSTTQINKASQATITDISAGTKVAVFGANNPDGSVTAQNIQLNPVLNFRGGEATRSPSGTQ